MSTSLEETKKFSDFTDGDQLQFGDIVVGLRGGQNYAFDFPSTGIKDGDGNFLIQWATSGSSAVNYPKVTNSDTGNGVIYGADGTDAHVDILVTPKGSGQITLDGINWPTSDGSANQAIITDGASQLSFATVSLVSTPTTDHAIARYNGTGGALQNSVVTIDDAGAISGATYLSVDNLLFNGNIIASASGDLDITPASGSIVNVTDDFVAGDPGTEGSGIDINGTTYDSVAKVSDIGGSNIAQMILHRHSTTLQPLFISARSNSDTDSHAAVTNGMTLFSHYAAGWTASHYDLFGAFHIDADSSGTISATSSPGRWRFQVTADGAQTPSTWLTVTNDKTATFTGVINGATRIDVDNLRLDGNSITSTDTNGDLSLTPDGTGDLVLDGLNWPQSDGSSNQALITDGAAQLSWGTVSVVTTPTVDQTIARFDGTGGALEDSGVTIDDTDVVSGITQLNVDNLRLDGNTLSSTSGDITLTPTSNLALTTGKTFTNSTWSLTSAGAFTGLTSVTASGTITAGTFTDSTASLTSGDLTSLTTAVIGGSSGNAGNSFTNFGESQFGTYNSGTVAAPAEGITIKGNVNIGETFEGSWTAPVNDATLHLFLNQNNGGGNDQQGIKFKTNSGVPAAIYPNTPTGNQGELILATENSSTLTPALTLNRYQNATFAGNITLNGELTGIVDCEISGNLDVNSFIANTASYFRFNSSDSGTTNLIDLDCENSTHIELRANNGPLYINSEVQFNQRADQSITANDQTINYSGVWCFVDADGAGGGPFTGTILEAGSRTGEIFIITNNTSGGSHILWASDATSNIHSAANAEIEPEMSRTFMWDDGTSRWWSIAYNVLV